MNTTATKTKYFKLHELLPPCLYSDEEHGWEWIDDRLKVTLDFIRELFGVPLICNNWKFGGKRRFCCARTPESSDYSYGSRHAFRTDRKVMAADVISTKMTAANMREIIKANESKLPYPVRLEKDVTWLHIDVDAVAGKKVYEFKA